MDSLITDMLIEIDIKISKIKKDSEGIFDLFSGIATSCRWGRHRFVIREDLANWVCKNINLGDHTKQITSIGQRYSSLSSNLKIKPKPPSLKVIFGERNLKSIGNDQWVIGHKILIKGEILQRSMIMVEGPSDVDFYKLLLKIEADRTKFGQIDLGALQGGGITLSENVLENLVENQRITISICDTDKWYPCGEIGETCRNVMDVGKSLNFSDFVKCTPCRALENFIPIDIAKFVKNKHNRKLVKILKNLIDNQDPDDVKQGKCLWLFYPVKSGVTKKMLYEIIGNCNSAKDRKWIETKYKDFLENTEIEQLPEFSDTLVKDFIKNKKAKEKYEKFLMDEYWNLHFSKWVSTILWYICGDKEVK